jgi:hypothetical protein
MTKSVNATDLSALQPSPGYLMVPFGWAAKPLGSLLQADLSLCPAIFTLSRRRMHLIALALAHWTHEIDAEFARLLIIGSPIVVLDIVLDQRPNGLKRALERLPTRVLSQDGYRRLIELLKEPATAKLIYHVDSIPIQEEYLAMLHSIPAPLRRIAARAVDELSVRPEGLIDGLHLLAARGAAPSFEALVADLAAIRQPTQFAARIGKLVQQLSLPEALPPRVVQGAIRLDSPGDIRRLAKRWKNCLGERYVDAVNDGRSAVYLWHHAAAPAACVVTRHGRLGWALEDAKGPENAELPTARLEEIHHAFATAGIPQDVVVEAIEDCARVLSIHERRFRRRGRRIDLDPADLEEAYEELATTWWR